MIKQYSDLQIALLEKLKSEGMIPYDAAIEHDFAVLKNDGLVSKGYFNRPNDDYLYVKILPDGETYLETKKVDDDRYHEPVSISRKSLWISLISLLISLVAILKSFGFF